MGLCTGILVGANRPNKLQFCDMGFSPVGNPVWTDSSGRFWTNLATGQYRVKVNDRCWVYSPCPLNDACTWQFVYLYASCVNQGSRYGPRDVPAGQPVAVVLFDPEVVMRDKVPDLAAADFTVAVETTEHGVAVTLTCAKDLPPLACAPDLVPESRGERENEE